MDNKEIASKAIVGTIVVVIGLGIAKVGGTKIVEAADGLVKNLASSIKSAR